MDNETRNAVLLAWKEAKEMLDAAKEKELQLRNIIVNESGLFDPAKESGTENVDLGNGWKIKAVKKINYNVDNADNKAFNVLRDIAALDPVSAHLAQRVISFRPELRKTEYDQLNPTARQMLDAIITTKPATPSLELVPPKE